MRPDGSGRAKQNLILDNLIAENKCRPILLVMNAGYAFLPDEDPTFFPGDYETELIHGCIPFIEQKYRVAAGRKNRAIAGLSLGSVQSFAIGMGTSGSFFPHWRLQRRLSHLTSGI